MILFFLQALLLIACTAAFVLWGSNGVINFLSTLIGGSILTSLVDRYRNNRDYLSTVFSLGKIAFQNKPLRISFSCLIRIKYRDRYILVKSKRFNHLWQPVGGVYKFFDSNLRENFGLQDDNGNFKKSDPHELRLSFPAKKIFKAFGFMKWFDSRLGREISPDREFREELIDTGIVGYELFKEVNFEFLKRYFDIRFSEKFQSWELMAYEIFELKMQPEQQKFVQSLIEGKHSDVIALTKNEIDRDGFVGENDDFKIGTQTKYIL